MRNVRHFLCVLLITALPAATALAKPVQNVNPVKPDRLADYVLTWNQFSQLNIDQKITYYKSYLKLLSVMEDLQMPLEKKSKESAAFFYWRLLLQQAQADEAYVKDRSIVGKYCIYGGYASQYYYNAGSYYCKPVGDDGCSGSRQHLCPSAWFGDKVCVTRPRRGQVPGLTATCVKQFEKRYGANLDANIANHLQNMSPADRQKWDQSSKQVKSALDTLQATRFQNIGFREYCHLQEGQNPHTSNSMNHGLQNEECASLGKMINSFDARNPAALTVASGKPAPDAAAAVRGPVSPAQAANVTIPQRPGVVTPNSYSVPTSPAQHKSPAKMPKNLRVPRMSPAAATDCRRQYATSLGPLACVACGLAQAFPKDAAKGFTNWISLVGIMAQTYHGRENVAIPNDRARLQRNVIDMISSYGYCTDADYPIDPQANGDEVRSLIDGQKSLSGWSIFNGNGKDKTAFANIFGFKRSYFSSMTYAEEIFHQDWFDKDNVHQRQWRFRSMLQGYRKNFPSGPFAHCAAALENNISSRSASHKATRNVFNMCVNTYYRPGGQMNKRVLANNDKLYKTLSQSCGLSGARPHKNYTCDNTCWRSGVFGELKTRIRGCINQDNSQLDNRGGADHGGKGGEGGEGHGGGVGKGGEPSGSHGGEGHGGSSGPGSGGGGGVGKGGEGGGGSTR